MYALYRDGATLDEVGARFHLTKERVRQLFDSAGLATRSTSHSIAMQRERLARERGEEICAAFAESKDIAEVSRRLKIGPRVVREVVENHFSEAERRRPAAAPQVYSDEELIAFLREADEHTSSGLSIATYREYANGRRTVDGRPWPGYQTHANRLGDGSWRVALESAGLKPVRPSSPGPRRRFNEADCVEAVRAAARKLGKAPTAEEYFVFAKASNGAFPSQATVRQRVGTWYEVLTRAGI
jgi:hypothetical protein